MTANQPPKTIDEYISGFPRDVQEILQKIRMTVKKAAPDAEETIKYQMPTFTFSGNLVYFAAFKNHIGFYPPVTGDKGLGKQLSVYEGPKGSLKFPMDEPIPYDLIKQIVEIRLRENLERARAKQEKKQKKQRTAG
ncbi:MAG: iron chaperone [Flavisolibacter sp.]